MDIKNNKLLLAFVSTAIASILLLASPAALGLVLGGALFGSGLTLSFQ